ncbi:coiled-coil domain-containing protein 154 isoform X9 [Lemur catta]|uniref:coiled-coil domain-containing protein 154 isoform X9 n=1 Tax=Lemur catta TaxID=9447 RepID=UPI001E26BA99|nr:coiled-coil domain-containing protein 154 isoform X9 [Lemur catta]
MRPATWRPPPLSPSRTVPSTGSSWSSGCPRCRRRWPACGGRRSAASTPRWACCGSCCRCGPSCGCRTRSCSGCSRRCSGRLPPLRRRRQSPLAPRARTRCRPWTKGTSTYALKHSLGGRGGIGLPEGSGRRQSPFPGGLSCSVSNTRVWAPQRGLGLTAPRQPMVGTQWEAGSRSPPGGTPSPQRLPRELWACRKRPLCARLVEVREALRQVRRQTLQDSERKDAEQEMALRVAKLTDLLRQEEQSREAACSALQRGQEDASQRVGHEVARMQAQVTTLGEEMSLRFLKREAKLCGFLQKSFLALEKRMKAAESSRLRLEGRLREELEGRWGALRELMEERLQAQCGLCKAGPGRREDAHLLEQCRGLDAAVVQLTKFVQQNQASLNRVLLAEQKALEAKGRLQEGQAEELASQVQEGLEAARRALQETCGQLAALREKSQVLEASVAQLAAQLKDLSDQFLTLSCRLDLQGQVLGLRLSEAKTEWEGAERKSLEDLARWQKEVAVQLQGLWEKVDGLPRQIEGVSDKCVLHKSDSDIRISAEGRARESEVGALRRELAALLSAVQLLKEDNPGRKIAEMQGRMATFQNQIIKLENSIQANRTIQNLQFNTETKLRAQKMAALRDSARLWGEEGPWARALGSRKAHTSPGRQRFFVKDVAPGEVPVNRWGVYQATRWDGAHTAPAGLPGWASGWSPRGWGLGRGQGPESRPWQVAAVEGDAPEPGGPVEAGRGPAAAPQRSLRGASRLCSSHRNKRALTCRAGP